LSYNIEIVTSATARGFAAREKDEKQTRHRGAAVDLLLAAASYVSPHWTLYQMRIAIEKRDADAFSEHVDFPALRESFKGQMMVALNQKMGGDKAEGNPFGANPFAAMGQAFATALISPMIDAMVTPAGVIAMMNSGTPKPIQAIVTTAMNLPPSEPTTMLQMRVSYQGWSKVTVQLADSREGEGSFVFKRQGLWSWRLSAVELSAAAEQKAN
jgi:hypothetical protein